MIADTFIPACEIEVLWAGTAQGLADLKLGAFPMPGPEAWERPEVVEPADPPLEYRDGVAIITIDGPLVKRPTLWALSHGFAVGVWIAGVLAEALEDEQVVGAVLRIGSVPFGCLHADSRILDVLASPRTKPVAVHVERLAAGPAVRIGVAGDAFFASPAAAVGGMRYGVGHAIGGPELDRAAGWIEREQRRVASAMSRVAVESMAEARPVSRAFARRLAAGHLASSEQAEAEGLIDQVLAIDAVIDRAARGDVGRARR